MDAARAVNILGINQPKFAIANMEKALRMLRHLNSVEEEGRLTAATWALNNWKEFQSECSYRRDRANRGE